MPGIGKAQTISRLVRASRRVSFLSRWRGWRLSLCGLFYWCLTGFTGRATRFTASVGKRRHSTISAKLFTDIIIDRTQGFALTRPTPWP
jgi:hypothetical protein